MLEGGHDAAPIVAKARTLPSFGEDWSRCDERIAQVRKGGGWGTVCRGALLGSRGRRTEVWRSIVSAPPEPNSTVWAQRLSRPSGRKAKPPSK